MTITNSFGDLSEFKPAVKVPAEISPSPKALGELAKREGFSVDNHPVTRKRLKSGRTASKEPAEPMTLRIRVSDWNRFSSYCERHEYTVAEGFERLSLLADPQ